MSYIKKIISVILIFVLTLSAVIPATQAAEEQNYYMSDDSRTAPSTAVILKMLAPFSILMRVATGKLIWSRNIELKFEKSIATDLCDYLRDNSGLDIIALLNSIPLESRGIDLFYDMTGADIKEIREKVYELSDREYNEGNQILSILLSFLNTILTDIQELKIYTVPADNGDEMVSIDVCFRDGTVRKFDMGIYFNEDGLAYNPSNTGILDLGFNCSVYDLLIYATVDSWMRDFGFCFFYDFFCYVTPFFNYNTRRFKFDYDEKEWMVQVWKGNYLVANGGECGIYNRDPEKFGSYYDCFDGTMPMTLKISHDEDVIYDIAMEHWWINGFKLTDTLYRPESLTMDFSIEMPEKEMAEALAEAIENEYHHDVICTVSGNTVVASW